MHVEEWLLRQPSLDPGTLVGTAVLGDQVQLELLGHLLVGLHQEAEKLLVPMPWLAFGDYGTANHIQRGKQGVGVVADVVMRYALHISQSHRQQRLGPFQSLDLHLLVNAEHVCILGGG